MAYLTPETRRKRRKVFCLIIEIICLVHFAIIVPRDRVFTPEKWAQTPAPMRHKLLQGSVEYKLADDWMGGWRVYYIDYKQDRVIRAIETWQDW